MVTRILVYDNQLAYFELLKRYFSDQFEFILFNSNYAVTVDLEFDVLCFFLGDEIELLDFVKLYSSDIAVVLGLYNIDESVDFKLRDNIHYLNLNKFKNEIILEVNSFLNVRAV